MGVRETRRLGGEVEEEDRGGHRRKEERGEKGRKEEGRRVTKKQEGREMSSFCFSKEHTPSFPPASHFLSPGISFSSPQREARGDYRNNFTRVFSLKLRGEVA